MAENMTYISTSDGLISAAFIENIREQGSHQHEMDRLEPPDLPKVRWDRGQVPLFWQGHPVARLQCRPDIDLVLDYREHPPIQV